MFRINLLFFTIFFGIQLNAQQKNPLIAKNVGPQRTWVDSIYTKMSLEEKIGQLFMADIFSSDPKSKVDALKNLIEKHHIGGVIFSKGGPVRQARLNNELQSLSDVPLLIGMDAEWGLDMRLDSTYAFPYNMALGAINDNKIVEEVGRQIGLQNKRLGVHINFAPVVDINVNPKNPIIGNRSFGENRENVTQKSIAFLKGMQRAGVLGSAKHFPGHGDTDQDSHKTLPTLNFTRERLDSVELYPYKRVIEAGVASVMVGHLNVPALESRANYPTSLSKNVVTSLLQDSLGFNGLIFTDALNMKGAANYDSPGEIDLAAFQAGNDILLISEDIPKAVQKIKDAYNEGQITKDRLARSVKKILYAKYLVGLNTYKPVAEKNLIKDLNATSFELTSRKAIAASLTVLRNEGAILPVKELEDKKIAYVTLGDGDNSAFYEHMNLYAKVDKVTAPTLPQLLERLRDYNYVVVGFHKSTENPWKSYKFSAKEQQWLGAIAKDYPTVLDLFVSPYALLDITNKSNLEGIILSYQNSKVAQELSAQLLFGAISAQGSTPVSLGSDFPIHTSYQTGTLRRLQYGLPEEVDMDPKKLNKIDSLVQTGLDQVMFPGAQVLVARRGKVIYNKNFGYHTYNKTDKVEEKDVYDLASLTKVLATLPLIMELHSKDQLDLDDTLGDLLPVLEGSNKENIKVKEVLSHYGGFKPWIPFYISTLDPESKQPSKTYYRTTKSPEFDLKVADELFLRSDYEDTMVKIIKETDLLSTKRYLYSDLPYYLFKEYLVGYYGTDMDNLTQRHFYERLGAYRTGYRAIEKFKKATIIPSENDTYYRRQQIQGYVHDMGAAMEDNMGGHAGLFSNANGVAKIMQMYLQNGYYGGVRFFSKETMNAFNTCYYCADDVRRGVGFDKPQLHQGGPTCGCVSKSSFGHSGFTGTYTWADPESEILFVFLSNRTFPTAENRKLITSNLRTDIQRAIQESIIN
ncbi:glycoside hydrolase family 3 N-terminal domain-containing protein [Flavimarina sp. Hel_I_48]|uniref:glycoside hydrolase family 3 N-terminal domain-containing protein n=1 Tax=Flavimarina sp. Hel_I_48 TaxID=1392488 RepID=UPI0004DF175A|nr:glycoside hydrolase family 3 N-terminal domain-containing protein [Flavimarina sp. Hel_I_48]